MPCQSCLGSHWLSLGCHCWLGGSNTHSNDLKEPQVRVHSTVLFQLKQVLNALEQCWVMSLYSKLSLCHSFQHQHASFVCKWVLCHIRRSQRYLPGAINIVTLVTTENRNHNFIWCFLHFLLIMAAVKFIKWWPNDVESFIAGHISRHDA